MTKPRSINDAEELLKAGSCVPNMTPYVLMIALSVHALFEGIAVGITTELKDIITLVMAIAIHKGAASSALGISLVKTFPNDFVLCRWLIFTFSLATPLGIVVGMSLQESDMVNVVINCLAAGSFVYIACSEVIVEEFTISDDRGMKLLFFIVGILLISTLWLFE